MKHNNAFKLKINLFGEGESLYKIYIANDKYSEFEKIAYKLKLPLDQALIDPFFYHNLNNKLIKSFTDLQHDVIYSGLLDTSKNQIEIWYAGKKVQKLKIENLSELLLFPLYDVRVEDIENEMEGIYIKQKEIGLIGSFEIMCEEFLIDKLKFKMIKLNACKILQYFDYLDHQLPLKKKDTLLQFQTAYTINYENK